MRASQVAVLTSELSSLASLACLDYYVTSFDGQSHRDSVKAAFERRDCKISPARLKNQGFVLLHSLIEGCHEVCVSQIVNCFESI